MLVLEVCLQLEYNPTIGTGRIFIWEPNRSNALQLNVVSILNKTVPSSNKYRQA